MLSTRDSRELRAMVLAIKTANRDMRKTITARMRETMNPVWRQAVAENITWDMERRVLNAGVRVAAGNPPTLQGATSRRRVGRSLIPTDDWAGFEYGADRAAYSRYERKNRAGGGYHVVQRRTMRHLRPRKRAGYVFGPAVAETLPRLASLAVQSVVRTYMDIFDRKG